MSGSELTVAVVNPAKKERKKMAAKKKKNPPKKKSNPGNPGHKKAHHRPKRRRRNPSFHGTAVIHGLMGAGGALLVDYASSMLPLDPLWTGAIELAGGVALAGFVDHGAAKAGGSVLMALGGFKVVSSLMSPAAKKEEKKPDVGGKKRPGMRAVVEDVGEYDDVGDYDDVAEGYDGVGEYDDVAGELEEGGQVDAVGEYEDVGEYDAVGEYEDVGEYDDVGEYEAALAHNAKANNDSNREEPERNR